MPPAEVRPNPAKAAEQPPAEGIAADIRFLTSVFAELCGGVRRCGPEAAAGSSAPQGTPARPCSAE